MNVLLRRTTGWLTILTILAAASAPAFAETSAMEAASMTEADSAAPAAEAPAPAPSAAPAPPPPPPPAAAPASSMMMSGQGAQPRMVPEVRSQIVAPVLRVVSAVLVLLFGWIMARVAKTAFGKLAEAANLHERIEDVVGGKIAERTDNLVRHVAFWVVMLITLVAFFDTLGIGAVTAPLNQLLGTVLDFLPRLLAATILLLVAIVLATLASRALAAAVSASGAMEKLLGQVGISSEEAKGQAANLGRLAQGLILLVFLPGILETLQLGGLLSPVQNIVDRIAGIVPNLFGAALLLFVGWFAAKILRELTTALLSASGLDKVAEQVGLGRFGAQPLSRLAGTLVYTLILIPILTASLQTLGIHAISEPATRMLGIILAAVPKVVGASLVLLVSWVMARLVAELVTSLLKSAGFDGFLRELGLGGAKKSPSDLAGYLVLVGILLFASIEASSLLGFGIVAVLIAQFTAFLGKVALAVAILVIGLYLARVAHTVILESGTPSASTTAAVARGAVIVFASAMALRQADIAEDIVNMAFAFFLGSIAVAAALAFGLGCREMAAQTVKDTIDNLKK